MAYINSVTSFLNKHKASIVFTAACVIGVALAAICLLADIGFPGLGSITAYPLLLLAMGLGGPTITLCGLLGLIISPLKLDDRLIPKNLTSKNESEKTPTNSDASNTLSFEMRIENGCLLLRP